MRYLGYTIAAVALLAVVYVGSYYAMVGREFRTLSSSFPLKDATIVPKYRFGGESSEGLFSLWHDCDRRIRPRYWSLSGWLYDETWSTARP